MKRRSGLMHSLGEPFYCGVISRVLTASSGVDQRKIFVSDLISNLFHAWKLTFCVGIGEGCMIPSPILVGDRHAYDRLGSS